MRAVFLAALPAGAASVAPPGLTFVGRLPQPGRPDVFVWEDLLRRDGAVSFYAADNATLLAALAKRDVDAGQASATDAGTNATCCGHGFTLDQLTSAGPDLLGRALLAGGDDPDEAAVAAALPPFIASRGQIAAFVGSRRGPAYPLTREGDPARPVGFTHPWGWPGFLKGLSLGPQHLGADRWVCERASTAGVVGGYLPALRWTYNEVAASCAPVSACCARGDGGVVWDITVLGEVDPPSPVHQTVWWRYLRYNISTGEMLDAVYVENNQAYPSTAYDTPALRAAFYGELLKTANSYDSLFGIPPQPAGGERPGAAADLRVAAPPAAGAGATDGRPMAVAATDPAAQRLIDQARHSLIREWITRPDVVWGRYGVLPDMYGNSESDGFQENVNSGATAAIAWGFLGTARGILSTYWKHIVRDDGGIKYRGAMMPGYGRMLTVLAQYISVANDTSIVTAADGVSDHVDAVLRMVLAKLAAAKRLPQSHIAHGLPMGCDEADACYMYSTFNDTLGELPYFSSAMEVWRGLRDLGRVFATGALGAARAAEGAELGAAAAALSADIAASWAASVRAAGCPPYVAGAGANRSVELSNCTRVEGLVKQYHELGGPGLPPTRPATTFLRTSEPWRAYAEMFHSGWLSDADAASIYQYQQGHDSLMRLGVSGGVNVNNAMFGHTAYGTAAGLVGASMAEEFLLLLFATSHHGATPGTWTFWEKVLIDRSKSMCCYAAPAQLTVPSALRWALVWEDEGEGLVALARALPRAWLSAPNASVAVADAPVSRQLLRSGSVGYSIRRSGAAQGVVVSVAISADGAGGSLRALSVRVRCPKAWGSISSVTSGTGEDWTPRLGGKEGDVLSIGTDGDIPGAAALQAIRVDF